MSDPNKVRFERTAFAAARPEVLPLLVEASAHEWGMLAKFRGTEADLIAAGLATPDQFQGVGEKVMAQKLLPDVYGNHCTVKRRGRGTWDLTIRTSEAPYYGDVDDETTRKGKWWRENGPGVEAATVEILARFVRAHREARS